MQLPLCLHLAQEEPLLKRGVDLRTKPHETKLSLLSKTPSLSKGKEVPHLVGVLILVAALPEEGAAQEGYPPNEMSRPITPNPKKTRIPLPPKQWAHCRRGKW